MFFKFWGLLLMTVSSVLVTSGCDDPKTPKDISSDFFQGLKQDFKNADTKPVQLALKQSCTHILKTHQGSASSHQKCVTDDAWIPVCRKISTMDLLSPDAFLSFLEENFQAFEAHPKSTGMLTGYFQPELRVSKTQSEKYPYPIYRKPDDLILIPDLEPFNKQAKGIRIAGRLVDGSFIPYATRADIEQGYLDGKGLEIAYAADAVDVFFMHIQGSGKLIFDTGETMLVSYAATNGKDYTAIGKVLVAEGHLLLKDVTMMSIKKWLKENPEQQATVLNTNESYVFFHENKDQDAGTPIGAQNTSLTPFASVATDPHYFPLGSLLFMKTDHPEIGHRFVVAQDVGGAIKGDNRADFFCGTGEDAGNLAGALKENVSFVRLKPKKYAPTS